MSEPRELSEVERRFVYAAPTEEQISYIVLMRRSLMSMAAWLERTPMDPRCRALAITKLEEASMWANKGFVFAPKEGES